MLEHVRRPHDGAGVAHRRAVHLFQPRETIRYRTSASAGGNGDPEYPAPGAHIDVWFAAAPAADTKLEILDAKGQVVRSFGVARRRAPAAAVRRCAGPFGRGGGPHVAPRRGGHAALHLGHALSRASEANGGGGGRWRRRGNTACA